MLFINLSNSRGVPITVIRRNTLLYTGCWSEVNMGKTYHDVHAEVCSEPWEPYQRFTSNSAQSFAGHSASCDISDAEEIKDVLQATVG